MKTIPFKLIYLFLKEHYPITLTGGLTSILTILMYFFLFTISPEAIIEPNCNETQLILMQEQVDLLTSQVNELKENLVAKDIIIEDLQTKKADWPF